MKSEFTFSSLESQLGKALDFGYRVMTCNDYYEKKSAGLEKIIVNRVDVDLSVKKAERFAEIFEKLGVKATFFIRLHAPEYNFFSFENFRIIDRFINAGHEIGLHTEVLDQANIWKKSPADCLSKDIEILQKTFDININGCASHNGVTGINNLDFFKSNHLTEFGLKYEAYDGTEEFGLFYDSLYVSDSRSQWKCYYNGRLIDGDNRSLAEHIDTLPPKIYLLTHPDNFFVNHIYE